jgi:seryl-tRNA synthetase
MSDTPRTKDATFQARSRGTPVPDDVTYASFAAGLERELADAMAELNREIQAKHRVAMETRNPLLAKLEALSTELAAANAKIRRLEEALEFVVPFCPDLHHPKRYQHKAGDRCPVEEIIRKAKQTKP